MCLGATGVVTAVRDEDGLKMAVIDTGSGEILACLLTCPEANAGDTVLVHSGYVLRIFDTEENVS